jgi:hypothetical protein
VHQRLVSELRSKRRDRINKFAQFDRKMIEMAAYGPSNYVKIAMADFMDGSKDFQALEKCCNWQKEQEPIVLLELTLWKRVCLLNAPEGTPRSTMEYFCGGGWKKEKAAHRCDPMIGTVITNVIPFLDIKEKNRPF